MFKQFEIRWNNFDAIQRCATSAIQPNPSNPRLYIDPEEFSRLVEHIRKNGVSDPIKIFRGSRDEPVIWGGERRWLAAREARNETVPVRVVDLSDKSREEIFFGLLADNDYREDLHPLNVGIKIREAINRFGLSLITVALKMNLSETTVSNYIALATLPEVLHPDIFSGTLGINASVSLASEKRKLEQQGNLTDQAIDAQIIDMAASFVAGQTELKFRRMVPKTPSREKVTSSRKAISIRKVAAPSDSPKVTREDFTHDRSGIVIHARMPPGKTSNDLIEALDAFKAKLLNEDESSDKR